MNVSIIYEYFENFSSPKVKSQWRDKVKKVV